MIIVPSRYINVVTYPPSCTGAQLCAMSADIHLGTTYASIAMNDLTLICSALYPTGGVGWVALHVNFIIIPTYPSLFSLHVVIRVGYGNFFRPAHGSVRHLTISSTHSESECSHDTIY